ncbi:flagellar hook-associated protein FlgL [Methylomonas rapida]|uniref:Flagellar hook-associated protein FlgL n=1 Tax=Methylomonas rapida TaxID=2963939 RepID=A0ABY7GGS3_9GAMM|nr:flagellar hook-associated protein FlgL [Methylomonas rapida]WAR44014.1 flagellar hook-associated protein FlgL [Methylomonas rapida]
MRISTSWSHQLAVNAMLDQQAKLSETQLKLSSNKKYLTPSENPVAATSLIDLEQNIKESEQYQVNIGAARQRLGLEESSLSNATDALQSIQDLALRGLNGSISPENRKQIAEEIDLLKDQLLGIANTKNANGEYIFSGYKTDQKAFTHDDSVPPVYTYQGDTNQRKIEIGPDRQVADGDPGNEVFGNILPDPLTLGSIENVFQAIETLSAGLKNNTPDPASLGDISKALERFSTVRASVGARMNALDVQENRNADYILDNKSTASEIGDLDYAEALSKFNLQEIALQAAQQAYVKVQNLSLFNYM